MLDPQRLLDEVDLDRVGLVVPVATLGRPVPVEAVKRIPPSWIRAAVRLVFTWHGPLSVADGCG